MPRESHGHGSPNLAKCGCGCDSGVSLLDNSPQINREYPSTVGRAKAIRLGNAPPTERWRAHGSEVAFGDALHHYARWPRPDTIVSDGAYGVLGFEGDTSDHLGVPAWYEPHAREWVRYAKPGMTLWFWNSEIGWAAAHPTLERHGFRYVNANIWNKGVAGNVNTSRLVANTRRAPGQSISWSRRSEHHTQCSPAAEEARCASTRPRATA